MMRHFARIPRRTKMRYFTPAPGRAAQGAQALDGGAFAENAHAGGRRRQGRRARPALHFICAP